MNRFAIALALAVSVAPLSAFAGRDQSDIMLQQQTIKRMQEERAKAATATAETPQKLEDCKKMLLSKQP
jgi:hypothetical protein